MLYIQYICIMIYIYIYYNTASYRREKTTILYSCPRDSRIPAITGGGCPPPYQTLQTLQHYGTDGFEGSPELGPHLCREAMEIFPF